MLQHENKEILKIYQLIRTNVAYELYSCQNPLPGALAWMLFWNCLNSVVVGCKLQTEK